MTPHSPAPWREQIDDDGNLNVIMPDGHIVYVGNLEGTCGTCHANAALIAAAPELLTALQEATRLLWKFHKTTAESTWATPDVAENFATNAVKEYRAIIAKATQE